MKKITLSTREELNIYMSPMRQQLLRALNLTNAPMTPKMLADKLQISASGVQHHIKKLMLLGLLELDHVERINGITASYYKHALVTVQIGLSLDDGLTAQREVLVQDSIAQIYDGFNKQMKKRVSLQGDADINSLAKWGDILTGVIHLEQKESEELMRFVATFLEQHATATTTSSPWEYAIIAYNAEVRIDD